MFDEKTLSTLAELAAQLDENEYPEMCRVLSYCDYYDCDSVEEAVDVADELMECDNTKIIPPAVAKFIEEVYLAEIEEGNCAAATNLGALYYTGRIGVQDYEKAVYYYEIAAKGGERQAQENLGYCYYYGRTGERNYEKAFHYFALGAFDGHLRSLYKIGDMYRNGYYVEKNEAEAFYIYERCLNTMTERADPIVGADIMMRMGDCYFEGIGTEIDYEEALKFYQKSEIMFYKRLQDGDFLIRGCYRKVIERQAEAREKMQLKLPEYEWTR